MNKFVLFVVLVSCFLDAARANKSSLATQNIIQASLDSKKLATQEGRSALARSVNQYCNELQQAYPTNSPSEETWLNNEIAGESNRSLKAFGSAEFGRRKAKVFLDECLRSSQWALKAPEKSIYFMVLTHAFIRFSGDAAYFAKLNGVDAEKSWLEGAPRAASEALAYAAVMTEIDQK